MYEMVLHDPYLSTPNGPSAQQIKTQHEYYRNGLGGESSGDMCLALGLQALSMCKCMLCF